MQSAAKVDYVHVLLLFEAEAVLEVERMAERKATHYAELKESTNVD